MKISPNISIIQKEAHAACHPITIIAIQMRLIGLKLIHLSPMDFLHMVVTLDHVQEIHRGQVYLKI